MRIPANVITHYSASCAPRPRRSRWYGAQADPVSTHARPGMQRHCADCDASAHCAQTRRRRPGRRNPDDLAAISLDRPPPSDSDARIRHTILMAQAPIVARSFHAIVLKQRRIAKRKVGLLLDCFSFSQPSYASTEPALPAARCLRRLRRPRLLTTGQDDRR